MSAFDINNVEFLNILPDITIDTLLQKPFSIRKLKDILMEEYPN